EIASTGPASNEAARNHHIGHVDRCGRVSRITVKVEATLHFIPSGSAIELKYSAAYLPVGIQARNILALRFTLNELFHSREVAHRETEVVAPVFAGDFRDRHRPARC